jgi:serine/threonine protein phosphatase PrpC
VNAAIRLVDAARTDVGKRRHDNQDDYLADQARGLFAVADGMGGLENGKLASHTVVECLGDVRLGGDFNADALAVAEAMHEANRRIWDLAEKSGQMGSTVVALLIEAQRFAVLWAGDCRAYLLRRGALHQLSHDHTQVQDMVDRGLLSAAEAVGHPMGHVVSRAVGVEPSVEVDGIVDTAEVGDVFLLCCDGLHGVVGDGEIAAVLGDLRPAPACDRLLALALERGAPDNVTLVVIACDQATLQSKPAKAS